MKKTLFILLTVIAFSLAGCDIIDITNEKVEKLYPQPVVGEKTATSGIPLSINVDSEIEYLNIFRYELVGGQNGAAINPNAPVVNVGEIYLVDKGQGSVNFTDYYTSAGKYYKYAIRYKLLNNTYAYSVSSKQVSGVVQGTNPERKIQTKGVTKIPVTYDENQSIISVPQNTFDLPKDTGINETQFDVMVAISNNTKTLLFTLTYDENNKKYTNALRSALPDFFFDSQLYVKYIVGQVKTSYENPKDTVLFYTFHWTLPCEANLFDTTGTGKEYFVVTKNIDATNIADYTPAGSYSKKKNFVDVTNNAFFADYNF